MHHIDELESYQIAEMELYNQRVIRGCEAMIAAHEQYKSPLSNKEIKEMVCPNLRFTNEWRQAELKSRKTRRKWSLFAALLPLILLFFTTIMLTPAALILSVVSYMWCDYSLQKKYKDDSDNLVGAYSALAITDDEIREIMEKE